MNYICQFFFIKKRKRSFCSGQLNKNKIFTKHPTNNFESTRLTRLSSSPILTWHEDYLGSSQVQFNKHLLNKKKKLPWMTENTLGHVHTHWREEFIAFKRKFNKTNSSYLFTKTFGSTIVIVHIKCKVTYTVVFEQNSKGQTHSLTTSIIF